MGVRLLYLKWEVRYIIVKNICLVFLLFLALKQDLKSYKIPNSIIVIGYIISLLFFVQEYEWTSIHKWMGSMLIPIIVLLPLFIIKALGAGDIKLFSVIGGFFGLAYAMDLIVIAFIIGGVISIAKLISNKNFKHRMIHFLTYSRELHLKITNQNMIDFDCRYYKKNRDQSQDVIHFSIAIFIAYILRVIHSIVISKI